MGAGAILRAALVLSQTGTKKNSKKINPPGVCFWGVGADTFSSSHWTSEALAHIGAEGAETVGNVYWEEAQVTDAMETMMRKSYCFF